MVSLGTFENEARNFCQNLGTLVGPKLIQMRRSGSPLNVLSIVVFFLLIAFNGQSQHRLVLLHPTVSNIESMEWMVNNKVIDIPGVMMIGVYSAHEEYDYAVSERYISEHHLKNYELRKIEGEIQSREIYRENSCTPAFRKLFEESDAILFFGGPDIPAAIYGEKQNFLTLVTDPNRHYFEVSFFFHLIGGSRNPTYKPFLIDNPQFIIRAFCLGMQTMNVAAGGTLIQDIPTEYYHKNTLEAMAQQPADNQHRSALAPLYPLSDLFGGIFHRIRIAKTGYLSEFGVASKNSGPMVLSAHHQAAGHLGANLAVIATSADGKIIEALQHKAFRNVVGVQFHPEPAVLYQQEATFTTIPGKTFSPNELLQKSNSLLFHQHFWKDFSERVKKGRRQKQTEQAY